MQRLDRECASGVNRCCIGGGGNKVCESWYLLAVKTCEIRVDKGVTQLTGAIGAKVHKNDGIAIADPGVRLASSLNSGSDNKFIIFAALVCGLQRACRIIRMVRGLTTGEQVPRQRHSIPALVAIHGVVETDYRGDTAAMQLCQFGIYARD